MKIAFQQLQFIHQQRQYQKWHEVSLEDILRRCRGKTYSITSKALGKAKAHNRKASLDSV